MTRLNAASQQSMTRLGGGNHTGSQTTVTTGVNKLYEIPCKFTKIIIEYFKPLYAIEHVLHTSKQMFSSK